MYLFVDTVHAHLPLNRFEFTSETVGPIHDVIAAVAVKQECPEIPLTRANGSMAVTDAMHLFQSTLKQKTSQTLPLHLLRNIEPRCEQPILCFLGPRIFTGGNALTSTVFFYRAPVQSTPAVPRVLAAIGEKCQRAHQGAV